MRYLTYRLFIVLTFLVVSVFVPGTSPIVYSQEKLVPFEDFFPYNEAAKNNKVGTILSDAAFEGDQEKTFTDHYQHYEFSRWTRKDNLPELPKFREEVLGDLARAKDGGKPHDIAVNFAYSFCVNLISNPKCAKASPAIKYNCMLLLGGLNQKEAESSSSKAVPLPAAFKYVCDKAVDEKLPEYLQIGAMMSVNELALTQLTSDQLQQINDLLYKVIAVNVEADGNPAAIWKRELAIEGLKRMASPGQGNKNVIAMRAIAAQVKAPMSTRIAAMESLGYYDYNSMKTVSSSPFQATVAKLIADCLDEELNRNVESLRYIGQQKKSRSTKDQELAAMDMYSDPLPGQGDYKDSIFLRQRVIAVLSAARKAVTGDNASKGFAGLGEFGSEAEKEKVKELGRQISNAIRKINTEETSLEVVQENLTTIRDDFDKLSSEK